MCLTFAGFAAQFRQRLSIMFGAADSDGDEPLPPSPPPAPQQQPDKESEAVQGDTSFFGDLSSRVSAVFGSTVPATGGQTLPEQVEASETAVADADDGAWLPNFMGGSGGDESAHDGEADRDNDSNFFSALFDFGQGDGAGATSGAGVSASSMSISERIFNSASEEQERKKQTDSSVVDSILQRFSQLND